MPSSVETALGLPMWLKWLILAAVFVGIESIHTGWVLIWFTAGALAAAAVAAIAPHWIFVQFVVFIAASVGLLAAARPITYALLFKRHAGAATNVAAIIGREELCIQDIDSNTGRGAVRVFGTPWHATSAHSDVKIKTGERVRIVKLRDLELIVEPVVERAETAAARDGAT